MVLRKLRGLDLWYSVSLLRASSSWLKESQETHPESPRSPAKRGERGEGPAPLRLRVSRRRRSQAHFGVHWSSIRRGDTVVDKRSSWLPPDGSRAGPSPTPPLPLCGTGSGDSRWCLVWVKVIGSSLMPSSARSRNSQCECGLADHDSREHALPLALSGSRHSNGDWWACR